MPERACVRLYITTISKIDPYTPNTMKALSQVLQDNGLTEWEKAGFSPESLMVRARNVERLRAQVQAKSIYRTHRGGTDFVDLNGELDYSNNEQAA